MISILHCNIVHQKKKIRKIILKEQNLPEFLFLSRMQINEQFSNPLSIFSLIYARCSHYSRPFVSLRRHEMYGILLNQHLRQKHEKPSDMEQNLISWRTEISRPFTFLALLSSHEAINRSSGDRRPPYTMSDFCSTAWSIAFQSISKQLITFRSFEAEREDDDVRIWRESRSAF